MKKTYKTLQMRGETLFFVLYKIMNAKKRKKLYTSITSLSKKGIDLFPKYDIIDSTVLLRGSVPFLQQFRTKKYANKADSFEKRSESRRFTCKRFWKRKRSNIKAY